MRIKISSTTRVRFYCCFLAIGGLFCGYDFGVMTGLILMPSFQLDMTGIDENTNGIMISSLLAGAITGAIFSGPLADALGRKALMALGTVIFIFGNILQ